jgi:mannose-6-phosphate isomerase-like protein (cupin superfamily)
MIKKASEMKVDVFTNFLGGKGTLTNTHFIDKEDTAGAGRLFAKSVLTPGSSIGNHTHKGDFENYYILKGKALVNDNGEEHILEAGDSILTQNGFSHSIENVGDTDLEYIALIIFDKENI